MPGAGRLSLRRHLRRLCRAGAEHGAEGSHASSGALTDDADPLAKRHLIILVNGLWGSAENWWAPRQRHLSAACLLSAHWHARLAARPSCQGGSNANMMQSTRQVLA